MTLCLRHMEIKVFLESYHLVVQYLVINDLFYHSEIMLKPFFLSHLIYLVCGCFPLCRVAIVSVFVLVLV